MEYDLFISHASEDKQSFVEPLAKALQKYGLKVWYDRFELKLGDSLREKIDQGLANSKYGVVVLSRSFFVKEWPKSELDALVTRQNSEGKKVILPIWHNVGAEEVKKFSPILASKLAARSTDGIEAVVAQIIDICNENISKSTPRYQTDNKYDYKNSTMKNDDLQIRINPTRDRQRQFAQIQILNLRLRPILVDAWFVAWSDDSMSVNVQCERGALPVRLQDHERADLLVDISSHPVEQLKGLGIYDAEHKFWHANEEDLARFIHVAKQYQPKNIDQLNKEPKSER